MPPDLVQIGPFISEPVGKPTIKKRAERFDSVTQCITDMQQILIALDRELTEEHRKLSSETRFFALRYV
jgi:hypothetical protein